MRDGDEILTFASLRDVFYEGLLGQGVPSEVAQCAADGIVQDPALAPVIAAPYDDPDQETIAALRERVLGAVSSCRHLARCTGAQTTKYLASGWGTMIAEVLCSGSSWNSSVSFTPMRCSSSRSSSLAWSSRSGHAG